VTPKNTTPAVTPHAVQAPSTTLKPGDTIWIPETPPGPKFWDVFTTSLAIVGQVAAIIAATVAIIVASR